MCWTSNKIPIRNIATKDITCYKIFHAESIKWKVRKFLGISLWKCGIEKFYSLYRDYEYISYAHNPEIVISLIYSDYWDSWSIYEGYHSYSTLNRAKFERIRETDLIVKCVIPIGSTYYLNECNEIVSSNIIITDKIVG